MARGLLLACHPLPTIAVTVISGGLAAAVGLPVATAALLVAAVLTGQLSIGWSNDLIDAERDRRAGRTDKPLAVGGVDRRLTMVATGVAVLATVALSAVLGLPAGLAALLIVVCGGAYNFGVRSTVLSFLPYAVAFGILPATATLALPEHPWPAWWAMSAGAMLGVAAHLVNVLPDLVADAQNGIRGLPHRLGARPAATTGLLLVLAAAAVLLFGPTGPVAVWRWIAFGVLLVVGLGATTVLRQPGDRRLFGVLIAGATVDVLLFAASGTSLLRS